MLVLNLSLSSELVPNHPAKIPFDHMILEFWKTDKVFTFAADYMLGVYAYVYAHIKIVKLVLKSPKGSVQLRPITTTITIMKVARSH